jgi:hypothetical protein
MKASIPLKVKFAAERFGCYLMVNQPTRFHSFTDSVHSKADKSMSILLGRPICLRDEDCTVHFPKEVDDEL